MLQVKLIYNTLSSYQQIDNRFLEPSKTA